MKGEEIDQLMKDCSENPQLSRKQGKTRLAVLKVYQETLLFDDVRKNDMESYSKMVGKFYQQTNGEVFLDTDLICSQIILNDYLLNSEFGSYLQSIHRHPSGDELYLYALNYETEKSRRFPEIILATELYALADRILVQEKKKYLTMIDCFSSILGENLLSFYYTGGKIDENGKLELSERKKLEDEYLSDYQKALEQLESLFKEKILDSVTYQNAREMLSSLLSFYHNGYSEVSLPSFHVENSSKKGK